MITIPLYSSPLYPPLLSSFSILPNRPLVIYDLVIWGLVILHLIDLVRGVEGRKVVEKRVEGNSYLPPYLDVFKINKGEGSN